MGAKTPIEYCDSTVNPIMGCTGCELYHEDPEKNHCYAAALCRLRAGKKGWPAEFTKPEHFPGRLEKAIKWSDLTMVNRTDKPWLNGYPRVIFVNDMGDGFCPSADPWKWLAPYLWRMADSPHIWLLLTKWPKRMVNFVLDYYALNQDEDVPQNILWGTTVTSFETILRLDDLTGAYIDKHPDYEMYSEFYKRIAGEMHRWVSFEPLLGAVYPAFHNWAHLEGMNIEMVAAGGESGSNARPCHPDWARLLRDDCEAAGIPWLWKQNGEWAHETQGWGPKAPKGPENHYWWSIDKSWSLRVGKKAAGRTLDGELHNGMFTFTGKEE